MGRVNVIKDDWTDFYGKPVEEIKNPDDSSVEKETCDNCVTYDECAPMVYVRPKPKREPITFGPDVDTSIDVDSQDRIVKEMEDYSQKVRMMLSPEERERCDRIVAEDAVITDVESQKDDNDAECENVVLENTASNVSSDEICKNDCTEVENISILPDETIVDEHIEVEEPKLKSAYAIDEYNEKIEERITYIIANHERITGITINYKDDAKSLETPSLPINVPVVTGNEKFDNIINIIRLNIDNINDIVITEGSTKQVKASEKTERLKKTAKKVTPAKKSTKK